MNTEPRCRRLSRRVWLTGCALAGVEAGHMVLGVTGCGGGTTGRRFTLETRVTADVATDPRTVTANAWEVTVSRAVLALSDLVYVEGAPVARLLRFIRNAHAHPGHYREGDVLGEAHAPTVVDLLGAETSLGATEAVTGLARSVTLGFHDPETGAPRSPRSAVALVEGIARREGEDERAFIAHDFASDVLSSVSELPEVSGCPLQSGDFTGDGVVTLQVQVQLWLDQIDFGEVPAADAADPYELGSAEAARNAFIRGVKKAAAYTFSYRRT